TVEPEIATPLTVFETGGPPAVIVTAKALVAGTEPALSGSSNWSVNVVPETAASRSDGAVTSSVAVCAKRATRFANESWTGFGPGWVYATCAVWAFVTGVARVSVTVAPLIATFVTLSATVVPFDVTVTAKAL